METLSQTGNIFGFKPKFFLNNQNEILQENPIKNLRLQVLFDEFIQNKSFFLMTQCIN